MKLNMFDFKAFFRRFSWKTILLILIVASASIALSALVSIILQKSTSLHIPSIGNVKTFGVEAYWDADCKNQTELVDWGIISPGASKNVTFYLRSISNLKATFFLNATEWNPSNFSDYISLSSNYNGTAINPGEIMPITLTLSASSSYSFVRYLIVNNVEAFSFDIIIGTSEYSG